MSPDTVCARVREREREKERGEGERERGRERNLNRKQVHNGGVLHSPYSAVDTRDRDKRDLDKRDQSAAQI